MSGRLGRIARHGPVLLGLALLLTTQSNLYAQEAEDAGEAEFPRFAVDGQLRLRFEADGRSVGVDPDFAVLSRIRIGGVALLADWIEVYAQLQDARAWGTESNTLTDASADAIDLHQGYAVLGSGAGFKAKLGRQEMKLGDERLVGAVGWTNTGRAFDGARLYGESDQFSWSVFWMNVQERDSLLAVGLNPQFNQGVNDDGWLIGGFGTTTLGEVNAELTFLVDRYAITEESYTTNLRLHRGGTGLQFDVAGAYQTGPDREAWFASGKLGWGFDRAGIAAQLDYLSGNPVPDDAEDKAFNTLYATNHKFYGYMDYFLAIPAQLNRAGLVDAVLRGSFGAARNLTVRLDLHRFWTAEERFGETELGTEIDLVGAWNILPQATLTSGGGLFIPEPLIGRLIPAFAGEDDTTWWGFVQLELEFP